MPTVRELLERPRSFVIAAELSSPPTAVARAHERLKASGEEEEMLDGPVGARGNALAGTGAWANGVLERDHPAPHSGQGAP